MDGLHNRQQACANLDDLEQVKTLFNDSRFNIFQVKHIVINVDIKLLVSMKKGGYAS